MTTDLTSTLTALLDHWNLIATGATQKVSKTTEPIQGAYYAGVLFGMENARDDLAAVLATAMAAQTSDTR